MKKIDCILVGGGIMSITLAKLLHEFDSHINIEIYEKKLRDLEASLLDKKTE